MAKPKASKKGSKNPAPRVGAEYQAELPRLIEKHEPEPVDPSNSFCLGFPEIPLTWENCENPRPSSAKDQEPPSSTTPLPGYPREAWTEMERESFVLGLYIFEKKLALVQRFVGTKKMGDVLRFYYGKFYNSDEYRRWSGCHEAGTCRFYGKKLFTGWRHEVLLARLFKLVGKDFRDMLVESSIVFSDGRVTLEDYVFILKDIVGVSVLVKAFGIGEGRKDLTGTVREARKRATIASSVDSETPFGKAYSSLTPSEIVEILKGNSGLSETQSRDLFAKAVWPLLLARGWHSKQVKNHKELGLKDSTVFLISAGQNFSTRLEKGKQYFDSVSDILNFVGSQPQIFLGPTEKGAAKCKGNGLSDCDRAAMKFTVVDTSLADETKLPHKVSGLRTLPSRALNSIETYEAEQLVASKPAENSSENGTCFGSQKSETTMPNGNGHDTLQIVIFVDNNHRSSSASTSPVDDRQQSERMNHENSSSKIETKRIEEAMEAQRCSVPCNEVILSENPTEEELDSAESSTKKKMFLFDLNLPFVPSDSEDEVDMARDQDDSRERERPFDLNIPYVLSDSETDQCTDTDKETDMRQDNGDSVMKRPSFPSQDTSSRQSPMASLNHQTMDNNQRQSARSRSMTKRALEALELKFFTSRRRNN